MSDRTRTEDAPDVVAFLTAQHEQIKELLEQVATTDGAARAQVFTELRRLLVVHEAAEAEVVHARARVEIEDGEAIVSARLEEEHQAEEALLDLETLDFDSGEFQTMFARFRRDVLGHAEKEEREEFTRLVEELDDTQLAQLRTAAESAQATAPAHRHARAEVPPATSLAGRFTAMLDRARGIMTGHR